jgi:tetratricopeptide (TPR) repeat protein
VPDAVSRGRGLLAEHGARRPTVRLTLNCPLGVLYALQERWDDARDCLAQARSLADGLGYAEGAMVLPLFHAAVETLAGDTRRALALLDEAADAGRALKADGLLGTVARESARLLVDAGRVDEAAERLAATAGADDPDGPPGAGAGLASSDAADLLGLLARIAAARGRSAEAAALAGRAVRTALSTDSPVVQAVAWLDRADVLRQADRPARARAAAGQAGRRFEAKGHLPGVRRAAQFRAGLALSTGPHRNGKGR